MELIQQAAILNIQGAEHLERKQFSDALVSFNAALDCMSKAAGEYYWMKLIAQVAETSSLPLPDVVSAAAAAVSSPMDISTAIPLMAVPKPCMDQLGEGGGSGHDQPASPLRADDGSTLCLEHFTYSRALVFNPDVARSPLDRLFYSAILIYNCGLCFHQGGKLVDPEGPSKAASLYEICLDLLKESALRFNCSHIIISAMNNKACIHIRENEFDQASTVLDQLLSVMLSTKGAPSVFSEDDINGIMHNILLLKASCISPAA